MKTKSIKARKPSALKMARITRGFTQRQVGDAIGIDPAYLSLLEAGKREPSHKTMKALARLYCDDITNLWPTLARKGG